MWIVVSSVLSFFRVISNTYLCRGCSYNSDHRLQLGHFPACPSLPPHHCPSTDICHLFPLDGCKCPTVGPAKLFQKHHRMVEKCIKCLTCGQGKMKLSLKKRKISSTCVNENNPKSTECFELWAMSVENAKARFSIFCDVQAVLLCFGGFIYIT